MISIQNPYRQYIWMGCFITPSTYEVAQWYQRYQLKWDNNDQPDHISFEFDFMRFLCEQESQAWESGDGHRWLEEEKSFMNEHIVKWVPTFCEKVRKFGASDFYIGLADLTEGCINRNSKSETLSGNPKSQIRNPKQISMTQTPNFKHLSLIFVNFGFGICLEFRNSDLEFGQIWR